MDIRKIVEQRFLRIGIIIIGLLLILSVFIFNVSKPGSDFEGCTSMCSLGVDSHKQELTVVSLNMLHGFPRFNDLSVRIELIADHLRLQDPDLILLQEVPWTRKTGSVARLLAERLGMNYIYYRANGNRRLILFEEGEAILSRYPLKNVEHDELLPRAGFFQNRVVLSADVSTSIGDMRVFVTHLTHSNPEVNRKQVEVLYDYVEKSGQGVKLIAGDFNAEESSQQIQALLPNWIDVFRSANPAELGVTCCIDDLHNGPEEPIEIRIDYIFLALGMNEAIIIKEAELVFNQPFPVDGSWQWASDHIGTLVRLAIKE